MRTLVIVATVLLLSCTNIKTAGKATESAAIDCAKQDVAILVRDGGPTLLSATIGILQDGTDGWRDALASLGKYAGNAALACAVESARAGLGAGKHFAMSEAAARATGYISERGWSFAP
jgi:hypothetical protein